MSAPAPVRSPPRLHLLRRPERPPWAQPPRSPAVPGLLSLCGCAKWCVSCTTPTLVGRLLISTTVRATGSEPGTRPSRCFSSGRRQGQRRTPRPRRARRRSRRRPVLRRSPGRPSRPGGGPIRRAIPGLSGTPGSPRTQQCRAPEVGQDALPRRAGVRLQSARTASDLAPMPSRLPPRQPATPRTPVPTTVGPQKPPIMDLRFQASPCVQDWAASPPCGRRPRGGAVSGLVRTPARPARAAGALAAAS